MTADWTGLPSAPERDGWHWLANDEVRVFPVRWLSRGVWDFDDIGTAPPGEVAGYLRYLGPCLTPDEARQREAVAAGEMREACSVVVKKACEHLNSFAIAWGSDGARNTARNLAEIHDAIRALPLPTPGALERVREDERQATLAWAVSRWRAEVEHRPIVNVHRRSLDDVWRQVMRHLGGDPDALVGPSHDEIKKRGEGGGA